jgi:hypothetical protein
VLLLDPNAVAYQHLHIQTVMSLLLQSLHPFVVLALSDLHLYLFLNLLRIATGLTNLFQSLAVLAHFA